MKGDTTMASKWRNTLIACVTLIAALTASAAQAALVPVYRFFHLDAGRHFYTASEAEKAKVQTTYPRFVYEGVAFYAYSTQEAGTVPVYRFYHQLNGSHVYTASESEKQTILTNYPVYAYEGIAYYANPTQAGDAVALYRLYNTKLGTHFFTTSLQEANNATATWPWFVLEGAIYYVLTQAAPNANVAPTIVLATSATSGKIGDQITLSATVGDSDGTVSKVEYYRDGVKLGETTAAPHTMKYTLTESGSFNFTAVATDNGGMITASNTISANVTGNGGGGGANVAPTVFIAAATTSLIPGGSTAITATASDADGSISKVELYDGATLLSTVGYAPFNFTFTSNVNGTHNLTAVAYDNVGATGTSNAVAVIVSGTANAVPTVTLSASANAIANGGTSTLTAAAADSDGSVQRVEFYDGTTLLATDTTSPYTYAFSSAVAGVHALRAVAYDNMGASATSSTVNVNVSATSNAPPSVTMSAATNAVVAGGTVAISATATDADGTIAKVEFYDGTTLVNNDTTAPYGFNFSSTTVGAHTLTARAYDNLGAITTSAAVTVTITAAPGSNLPRITLSASNTLVAPNSTITLTGTATATATGATVARVSFFMDGVKLVDDTVTPYTYTLTVPAGAHKIYAQVADSLGNVNQTLSQTVLGQTAPAVVTTDPDVWRLLNQATFGASQAEAARVASLGGISAWIDDQFTKPISGYPDSKYNKLQFASSPDCTTTMPSGTAYPSDSPEAMCSRDQLSLTGIQRNFFTNAVYEDDQLRQRVAWALSQILVTSGAENDLSFAHVMSRYQSILFDEAFGNYRTLLERVSVNPAMGNYLDAVNNDRPAGTRVPNENYAREIMQLFSIGLVELNEDGTVLLDAKNNPVPTYGQAEIAEFARVFTGLTYSSAANPAGPATAKQGRYYGAPMVAYPTTATAGHDPTAKTLLNGTVTLANQTAQQDFNTAVLNVFSHENTPPFVSKQLIQRLVTGNPSAAYVKRVADVFKDNGAGVRGDMRAVVKAILMDAEARGGTKTATDFGTLKEPVLVITSLLRALSGVTDGAQLAGQSSNLGQNPYFSPTVFNYFPPDATIPGSSILAPEFAIHTTNSAVGRANLIYRMVYQGFAADPTIIDSSGTRLYLDQFDSLATNPAALVSQLNKVLAGGQFPASLEPTIVTAVSAVTVSATPTAAEKLNRIRMAVYLMASSYDYQVQR